MSQEFESLSGFWTGVYDYPGNADRPVPFNALIIDIVGTLSGEITEPHMGSDRVGPFNASLDGVRADNRATFIKTYDAIHSLEHSVSYDGAINQAMTRIEGTWTIPGSWSGPFVMDRTARARKTERRLEELVGEPFSGSDEKGDDSF